MYFSGRELTQLLLDSVENEKFDDTALKGLLYYLNFKTEEIPLFIAEVLIKEPELLSNQEILGKRLAYGHVQELSDLRNPELRTKRQIRISRQLNRIALFLEEQQAPSRILIDFSALCESFISTLMFFEARKQDERFAFAAEEVLLVEQLLKSILSAKELSLKFYETLFHRLGNHRAKMLATSLLSRLEEALKPNNINLGNAIIDPNQSPPLSKALEEISGFNKAVEELTLYLSSKSGDHGNLH